MNGSQNKLIIEESNHVELALNKLYGLSLYQKGKRFVFVPDLEKLRDYLEQTTGMDFHFEVAKNCNYFYHFWLVPCKKKL